MNPTSISHKTLKSLGRGLIAVAIIQLLLMVYSKVTDSKSENNSVSQELVVSAAASMQDVLKQISSLYLLENPDVKLVYNFGSSGSLQHQIEQGAPVDVFISAASREMNSLQQKNLLVEATRKDLVKNKMVLIVALDDNEVTQISDLAEIDERIAVGEPNSVPAGQYAKEILIHHNIWDRVKSQTVFAKDVRQVVNYVATGNIDAGIVYLSDTKNARVKIVATAPEHIHSSVVYPVAVIKNSTQKAAAQDFIEFLSTSKAQAIFQEYGFTNI